MFKFIEKNPNTTLIISCILVFFVNLDVLIINIMEARNFITAREMIIDNNWIFTTLNGEPRYQKPPLPTWLTAFSGMLFGLKNIFALRLPAALLATLLALFTYKFSLKLTKNKNYSLIGSLVLITSFYIVFAGRNGQWDIFTHGFMMICIYYLFLFFTSNNNKYQKVIIAALFFGFSFMSKGPVSLYALLLPFLIAFGIVYRYKNFKERLIPILAFIVVSLCVSGWWYWYTYTFDTQAVLSITKKETSNWTGYNIRPFYYYWSFFTQSGIWTIPAFVGLLYPYLKNKVFHKKAYTFSFIWTMTSVVLLSLIPEKKSRYLLPVLIPLALNTGFYLEYIIRSFKELKDKKETIPVYFNFGLIGFIGLIFPIAGYVYLKESLVGFSWLWFLVLALCLFSVGYLIIKNLKQKNILPVFYFTIAFILSIMCFGMPLATKLNENPEYLSLEVLNTWEKETNLSVYEYGNVCPEMIWVYGKPLPKIKKQDSLYIPNHESFGVLVSEGLIPEFKKIFKEYNIKKITRYDMNPNAPGSKTHRSRLWRDLYVVTRYESPL